MHSRIGCVAHVDQGAPESFHRPDHGGKPHTPGRVLHLGALFTHRRHEPWREHPQEALAQVVRQFARKALRVVPRVACFRHSHEHSSGITHREGGGDLGENDDLIADGAAGRDLV